MAKNLLTQEHYGFTSGTVHNPAKSRTVTNTYETAAAYVNAYLRNRLKKSTVTDHDQSGGPVYLPSQIDYDQYGATPCNAFVPSLWDAAGITYHDPALSTGYTTRGNPTRVERGGQINCYDHTIAGTVRRAQNNSFQWVTYDLTAATNFLVPTTITPNNGTALQESFAWNSFFAPRSHSMPNSATEAFTYDTLARPKDYTSPHGAVTTYTYDDRHLQRHDLRLPAAPDTRGRRPRLGADVPV